MPEIDGLSKDTVVTSWMAKYDALMKGEKAKKGHNKAAVKDTFPSSIFFLAEEDGRRPGQRPATNMLGNEVMSKEQLYDLYQQILGVKKFEHQLLYNAMQLDNSDEQAAAIRRELDARQEEINKMERNRKLLPKFVLKEMESLYIEEQNGAVNTLKSNLESLPVQQGNVEKEKKSFPFPKLKAK